MEARSFCQHSVLLSDTVPEDFDLSCSGLEALFLVWVGAHDEWARSCDRLQVDTDGCVCAAVRKFRDHFFDGEVIDFSVVDAAVTVSMSILPSFLTRERPSADTVRIDE